MIQIRTINKGSTQLILQGTSTTEKSGCFGVSGTWQKGSVKLSRRIDKTTTQMKL